MRARAGQSVHEIDTPALIVDLDAFERNLRRMADAASASGVRLRPHAKTHKSPYIAARQLAMGAVGVCCQKVSEAAVLVGSGIPDVLVTNEIWGQAKLDCLAGLARHARIGVCVDSPRAVDHLAAAARAAGSRIDVLVEIDVGAGRCGTRPGHAAAELAKQVALESDALRFDGIQAYHGAAQHKRKPHQREAATCEARLAVETTLEALKAAGIDCRTIGGAGTGTYELEAATGLWNELQCGSYIFMDADYAKNEVQSGERFAVFEHALFVAVTVMSHTPGVRSIVDAGHKALGNDQGFPEVWQRSDLRYVRPSDDHGTLLPAGTSEAGHTPASVRPSDRSQTDAEPGERGVAAVTLPQPGDRLLLVPGHCDPTVNLYDHYIGVRHLHQPEARVEFIWPVAARGATT